MEIIREASLGNRNFESQMLNLFLDQSVESLDKMKLFYKEQDLSSLSKQAHQLKSSFGMFLMDLSLLDLIEKGINQAELDQQIQALETQINEANNHIQTLINKTP